MWKRFGMWLLYWVIRAAVSIRYRIEVRGLENLTAAYKGALFLPNHPATVDPVILALVLWKHYRPRPLVVEQYYYLKGVHAILKLIGAVPIPDLSGVVNRWKEKKLEKCFADIAEGLQEGDNYLIYPAGRLKVEREEVVGGASFVYNLLQKHPATPAVLVRTTGLWGSRFSRAVTGKSPDFARMLWEGVKIAFKNLLFFVPKRDVVVEFEPMPKSFLQEPSRQAFNQALEKWYNLPGKEELTLVSDCFWKTSYPEIVHEKKVERTKNVAINPAIEQRVLRKVAEIAKRPEVAHADHLARDLGLDSLDLAELQTFLRERCDVEVTNPENLQTVDDIVVACAGQAEEAATVPEEKGGWPEEKRRPPVLPPNGATVQEAFLKTCDRMGGHVACADARMGVVTYRRLKLLVCTLRDHFREAIEEERVGILLPSSTISYALVLALLLAGKTPVMLNWTVGVRAINHCREKAELKCVITSSRFLEHLSDGDLGSIEDLLLFVEEIKGSIGWGSRLKGVLSLFRRAKALLNPASPTDPAVILFTSGTESLPKGVPLSHTNLLSNQRAGLACVDVTPSDVLYGVLPPFHSFGFSVTGLFPLLSGLKVFYAPDPTQYHSMARDVERWKVSMLCSAPTFMKGLFHVAKPNQLSSLQLAVGGAEKVPDELFRLMESLGGVMLEGYGITECGPIVTLTRPGKTREGVGEPLENVELKIIDAETAKPLENQGVDGEICIRGPNVFAGYLGDVKSPFLEIDGKLWYRSGDRGHLTPSGALVLTGRLKRFVKVGAEMVSLSSIEEELSAVAIKKQWGERREGPPLAVVAAEQNTERPHIVVFATFAISKEELNEALHAGGFGRIVKVSEVRRIETIPLMGTGKIHYRALQESL